MDTMENLKRLEVVFRDVLDNEAIFLTSEMTSEEIEEWDSLSNIQLIVAIEKSFGIKFSSKEIASVTKIGDILDIIKSKSK